MNLPNSVWSETGPAPRKHLMLMIYHLLPIIDQQRQIAIIVSGMRAVRNRVVSVNISVH